MSVKKKRTIGPCRGVTWLYYVVLLWSRDFFPPLYLDPRFRPLLLKWIYHKLLCLQDVMMTTCSRITTYNLSFLIGVASLIFFVELQAA